MTADDPIEHYVTTLASGLRGPTRLRDRMVAEVRDGLADAAAAHIHDGIPGPHAAHRAVREFGTLDELAPGLQRELTIAQTRDTARALALTVPALVGCSYLVWAAGPTPDRLPPVPAQLLVATLAGAAILVALLAVTTLLTTGSVARWVPTPGGLPPVVAWTGTATSMTMALAAITLLAAAPLATSWPLIALTAVAHGVVAASARACRQCARLPATGTAVPLPG